MNEINDRFNLQRFIDAQAGSYDVALAEIRRGRKASHWIWYIFPQITGLGKSYMCEKYAIQSIDEARAYLQNDLLRSRIIEILDTLLLHDCQIRDIVYPPDDMKICSCMTLFHEADPNIDVFQKVLDKFYNGNPDKITLSILKGNVRNIGRKPTREEMVAVFRDTMDCITEEEDLRKSVRYSIENTKLYLPDSEMIIPENPHYDTEITVTMNRSLESAKKLTEKYPAERIAVLNFASQTNAGGGVTTGARAQEESLCRCSTLYPCLNRQYLRDNYYTAGSYNYDFRNTDSCVYIPDLTVIKTDTNIPERMDRSEWYKVDIITCAAPNLRHNPYALSPEQQYEIHCRRAGRIISSAAINGATVLVLGAFGCGAFRNIPEQVAKAYKTVLSEFNGYFKAVEFAVFSAGAEDANYTAFRNAFQ